MPRLLTNKENRQKLQYLVQLWQKNEAFATAYKIGSLAGKENGGASGSYEKLDKRLQWDPVKFDAWKKGVGAKAE